MNVLHFTGRIAQWSMIVVLGLLLATTGQARADEGNDVLTWQGEFEGFVVEGDPPLCYSTGFWQLSFEADTQFFNFHFHGWTDDQACLGLREVRDGWPQWIEELLCEESQLCIDDALTRTHVSVNGKVLVSCHGFAHPCQCADEIQPSIVSVAAMSSQAILITFSEAMDEESVENIFNFSIIPPLTILSATRDDAEWEKVVLTTSPMQSGRLYRITVSNVMDPAGNTLAFPNYAFFTGVQ